MVKGRADYYRARAEEFRHRAEIAWDAFHRKMWLELAEGFEELAESIDPRSMPQE